MATSDEKPGRIKQLRMIAKIIQQANPKGMPIVFLSAVAALAVVVVIGALLGYLWYALFLGIMVALLVGLIVFGQLAQRAQYSLLHGQPGAAAAVLQGMRGNWQVTPAIAVSRDQDLVHLVIGYPGVILVSEGPGNRVARMLAAEKKRIARAVLGVEIYDIQCGDGPGQVPIAKLQRHIMKLPRNLKKPAVNEVKDRLRSLPKNVPMPKGPMPRGVRMPRGPKMR
ncbi:DUF4191 domain-containing protein [Thermoactinospora rubra]|uniref:DUF4191 domain-containing protein n=1 Tax=Thermoactinospora rubra TaxID=1088767 RepID=UPI00117F4B13|nr:DUF4191 domain-containing protein [Thermoactinospora rubra]